MCTVLHTMQYTVHASVSITCNAEYMYMYQSGIVCKLLICSIIKDILYCKHNISKYSGLKINTLQSLRKTSYENNIYRQIRTLYMYLKHGRRH